MSRKRKELPTLQGIRVDAVAAEGKAVARIDGKVIFIPYAAPGDVADIRLTRRKNSFAEGVIDRLVEPSPLRVEPQCPNFGVCGGCKWQHLPYDYQISCKQQQVTDALERIAKVDLPPVSPILGSESCWAYRNKMEYTFSNRKWLTREQMQSDVVFDNRDGAGFHIPGAFDKVLDIDVCLLQDDLGNRIRNFIRDFARSNNLSFYDLRANTGLLRTLMIRILTSGQVMAVISFGQDDPDAINLVMNAVAEQFPEITALLYVVNTKANDTIGDLDIISWRGPGYVVEQMDDLRFRIGPKSFYQTNSRQAHRLYSVARELAALTGRELVYDLYTGTGTIACFVARDAARVIGIEYVPEAIDDARLNAALNNLDNTEFFAGDMKDILTPAFIEEHGRPDVMIVDPPRAGMHTDVIDVILGARPQRIVYVSCNPATQARDIALLDSLYRVDAIRPVDMFPHTHHVENVVLLTLRQPQA